MYKCAYEHFTNEAQLLFTILRPLTSAPLSVCAGSCNYAESVFIITHIISKGANGGELLVSNCHNWQVMVFNSKSH